jgi:hypothetical protein
MSEEAESKGQVQEIDIRKIEDQVNLWKFKPIHEKNDHQQE